MSANQRNAPCSCGSGRKSKKCCDTPEARMYKREQEEIAYQKAREERRRVLKEESNNFQATGRVSPRYARMMLPMLALAACGRF